MEQLKEKVEELSQQLKRAEADEEKAAQRWQEEKNEILVNAQEVVNEGERRMEESVKEVEQRLKGEMEEVKKKASEESTHRKQTLVNIKMMTPSVYKEGSSWKDWREEIEDYTDEVYEGMADELKRVREANREIEKGMMSVTWWEKR